MSDILGCLQLTVCMLAERPQHLQKALSFWRHQECHDAALGGKILAARLIL